MRPHSRVISFSFIVLVMLVCSQNTWAQAATPGSTAPSFKLTGGADLMSNFVYRGLTETDRDPALQGNFWFNFGPQFRLGLWGSNVGYMGSDARLWLKYNGDVKVSFSQSSNLIISASKNSFYKEDGRNGWTYGLDLHVSSFNIIFQNETNWEGTGNGMNYLALGYDYTYTEKWHWFSQIGYSQLKTDGLANFFDLRTGMHYFAGQNIRYKIDVTGTSNSGQIGNGRANYFFILGAQVEY